MSTGHSGGGGRFAVHATRKHGAPLAITNGAPGFQPFGAIPKLPTPPPAFDVPFIGFANLVQNPVPGGDRIATSPPPVPGGTVQALNGRPGDVRGFVHKKIFGGITGAIGGFLGGGPLGALKGGVSGFGRGGQKPQFPVQVFQPPQQQQLQAPGCGQGFTWDFSQQRCVALQGRGKGGLKQVLEELLPGGGTGFIPFGEATMGRFGAGMEPGIRSTETRVCPRGAVLGQDGLCYNRRDLRNNERFWPKGRRPLLTGGDMRCISVASAAAKKLQRKQKQLEQLGMLKKPARRAAPALAPGHVGVVKHA